MRKDKLKKGKGKKKQPIPKKIKQLVWNTYIGEVYGRWKCLCCKTTYITQLNFHCGHVISEYNGGKVVVENLRPICSLCNHSMGRQNMNEFMAMYELDKKEAPQAVLCCTIPFQFIRNIIKFMFCQK